MLRSEDHQFEYFFVNVGENGELTTVDRMSRSILS